jgi:inner membrane protein
MTDPNAASAEAEPPPPVQVDPAAPAPARPAGEPAEKRSGRRVFTGRFGIAKLAILAALALASIIPAQLIEGLIGERQTRQDGVEEEFTHNWGPAQRVYGPILVVPYEPGPGRPRQYLEIAPAKLDLVTSLAPQERHRGLFRATVYDARLEIEGSFAVPSEARLEEFLVDKNGRLLWEESFIAFGATSLAGLKSEDHVAIDGVETPWRPCEEVVRQKQDCAGAPIILAKTRIDGGAGGPFSVAFKSSLSLRGTGSLMLAYTAKEVAATIRSPWPSPSFIGEMLPDASSVGAEGFEARWRSTEFGSPRIASSAAILGPSSGSVRSFGVDLIEATPVYRMIDRVAKYALLFIALAFATYLFFELLARLRIHVLQYGLVALSLSLFPLLLLSLGEMIGYTPGYAVSAALVLVQASLYTASVARRWAPALVFAAMLACLFGFIYVLVGMETYSLIVGALALFAVLSVLMVLTEKVRGPDQLETAAAGASP